MSLVLFLALSGLPGPTPAARSFRGSRSFGTKPAAKPGAFIQNQAISKCPGGPGHRRPDEQAYSLSTPGRCSPNDCFSPENSPGRRALAQWGPEHRALMAKYKNLTKKSWGSLETF